MSTYDCFTDGARKLMLIANQEAMRFQHEYIGTEHLLLALVKLDDVGADILKRLNVDPRKVRLSIEMLVQSGPEPVAADPRLPKTPRAKNVCEYAIEEARFLRHDHVGTEHILLGLLREEWGVAAQVLMNLGLTLHGVREAVRDPSSVPRTRATLPDKFADQPLVRSYRAALDALNQEKEEYVANGEFEKAAANRDQADQLKRQLAQLIRKLEAGEDASGMFSGE